MNTFFETMESRVLLSASVSSTQKANLTELATDLKAIHAASDVTSSEVHALDSAIATAVVGATRPSTTTVDAFETALKSFLAKGPLTTTEKKVLAVDFEAILTSADISEANAKAVASDLKVIVDASHITSADVKKIAGDLEAILATFDASH